MACLDRATWQKAVDQCNVQQSVKGFGYVAVSGFRGIGALNVAPTAMDNACAIAALTPCPGPKVPSMATCSLYPSLATCQPGGAQFCVQNPGHPSCAVAPTPPPPSNASSTTQQASVAGGFHQWGLLAALAVGGFVVYKVATHKKASA